MTPFDVPTWRELAARAAAIAHAWYRHSFRRWWRRHVTTRGLEKRLQLRAIRSSIKGAVGGTRDYELRDGSPIELRPSESVVFLGDNLFGVGLAGSSLARNHVFEQQRALQAMHERMAFEQAQLRYEEQRGLDAFDTIAGINYLPLPRRNDEPT